MRLRQPNERLKDGRCEATHKPGREDQNGRAGQHTHKKVVQKQRLYKSHESRRKRNWLGNHSQLARCFGA